MLFDHDLEFIHDINKTISIADIVVHYMNYFLLLLDIKAIQTV